MLPVRPSARDASGVAPPGPEEPRREGDGAGPPHLPPRHPRCPYQQGAGARLRLGGRAAIASGTGEVRRMGQRKGPEFSRADAAAQRLGSVLDTRNGRLAPSGSTGGGGWLRRAACPGQPARPAPPSLPATSSGRSRPLRVSSTDPRLPARCPSRDSRASFRGGSWAGSCGRAPAAASWSGGSGGGGGACAPPAGCGRPCAGCRARRRW